MNQSKNEQLGWKDEIIEDLKRRIIGSKQSDSDEIIRLTEEC